MAHDDALHAERNRLLDLLALKGCVLLTLKDVQIDAEGFSLPRDSRLIGLEIVALRKMADERDLTPPLSNGSGAKRGCGAYSAAN